MINKQKIKNAYGCQKGMAKVRGISFELTFAEWLEFWTKSGKLELRGRGRGKYVMARKGDAGPYKLGNIKICLHEENVKESWADKARVLKRVDKMRLGHLGKKRGPFSKTHKARISKSLTGRKFSAEHKRNMSLVRLGKPRKKAQ